MAEEKLPEPAPNPSEVLEAADPPVDFSHFNDPPEEPVKPKAEAKPTAAAVSTHPQALVDAAIEAGFSRRAIDKLDTEALYEVLVTQHRKLAEVASQRPQRQHDDEPPPRRQVEPDDPYEAELIRAQEDGMAPTLISAQRRMMQELKELKAQNTHRAKVEQERRSAEIFDAADEAIDDFAKSLDIEFTKGQKLRLFRAAGVLDTDSPRTVKKKVTEAGLELPLAKKPKTPPVPANGTKKPTVEEYEGRLPRPTASLPSRAKGDVAARKAVRDEMIRMGLDQNVDRDEFEGVPEN